MISKRDRYRGALVGVLAGDALLAPYETWDAAKVSEDLERRGGLVPFDYPDPWNRGGIFPMGKPTDDSDQTAALAESLISNDGLNEKDLFNRLRHVIFDHVSPLWEGKAVGAGKTTREALRPATFSASKARPKVPEYPSNGSLMRSAPMALFFGGFERYSALDVKLMCEVTHRHEMAHLTTNAYVMTLIEILNGLEPTMESEWFAKKPADPGAWPARGNVRLTYSIAMWAYVHAWDFRDGLTKVAMIGGDTDTYGAVAGGLLGARFGIDGIPAEWQAILKGRDKMIEYADALYELAHT